MVRPIEHEIPLGQCRQRPPLSNGPRENCRRRIGVDKIGKERDVRLPATHLAEANPGLQALDPLRGPRRARQVERLLEVPPGVLKASQLDLKDPSVSRAITDHWG